MPGEIISERRATSNRNGGRHHRGFAGDFPRNPQEGLPPCQPDLKLDDTAPFRLSRNHFIIEKRDGDYYVRDLCSALGTIVNGEPIGHYFRTDDAPLRVGDNEVIAGGVDSPFVFSVFI